MRFSKNKFIPLLILLLLGVFGICQANIEEEKKGCNKEQLIDCYIEYLATFLMPALPSPPSYELFSKVYLESQCKGGWSEQEILCGSQDMLSKCMKNNEECLKTGTFQEYLNLSEDDARSYQTDYKVRQYQCGAGKNSFQNMFFCYLKVVNVYDYEIQMCNDLQKAVISQDGNYNCGKAKEYVACMLSVYGRRCGTAVKPFICNIAEITLHSNTDSNVCDTALPRCNSYA